MPTNFKDIRAAIVEVVGEMSSVQEAYGYEKSTFEGFPAVVIVPTDNESDYATQQNDRIRFVFKIRAYYPIPDETKHAAAEAALEAVMDEMLDSFRARGVLGTACDWVEPAPSKWEYEERGEAVYRVAELTLGCVKYVA